MKKIIFGLIIGIISLSTTSSYGMGEVIPKKTPMQNVGNGAYCWTPDGKIAFYRLIDHWIKMEPTHSQEAVGYMMITRRMTRHLS